MEKAAEVVRNKLEHITSLWKEAVEEEIEGVAETERLLLLNVLPHLIKDIALVLERSRTEEILEAPTKFEEIIGNSVDHGRHRASTANFNAKKIIKEYMILHRILIRVLISEGAYNEDVGIKLAFVMETSMENSIHTFNQSIEDMREKLIGTLAHDIRNPLAAANLGLDTMKYQYGEDHFNKTKERLRRSIRRSINLVEDLLDTVTVKAGEGVSMNFSPSNFVDEVKFVFNEAQEFYSREFIWVCDDKEITGVFDPTAIRRVTENLITNAVKYGAPDSPITVSVESDSKRAIMKIHNEGNSICPEDHKDIFMFLNQNHQNSHGELKSWGIGLSFVKMAAEAHKGHVDLESDDENGTTFRVVFLKNANKPGRKKAVLNLKMS